MLFPPIEMLYLAAIARSWHQSEVLLLDAIAENVNEKEVESSIRDFDPDVIVCITGFEIFESDIRLINTFKKKFTEKIFVVFGHYPTHFPAETLHYSGADYVLEGEPDINFSSLLDHLSGKIAREEMVGVFYNGTDGNIRIKHGAGRIKKPDELPIPAHDLLKINLYNEPFLSKPFGLIQSARGCPYSCNFCVRSYGSRLALRSPESIIEEIKMLVTLHKIKSLRFIDDTFTATSKRVIRFCKLLLENEIRLQWTCLSRPDTLDEEMISWMKKAGCVRVYIGIESGSQKILDIINKQIDLVQGLDNIRLLQKYGIETSAFFMVGYPEETVSDFKLSMEFARKARFDYVIPFKFTAYPGTLYYDQNKDKVDFNLFPYRNTFKIPGLEKTGENREKEFYKDYYFRLGYLGKALRKLIVYPNETLSNSFKSVRFQLNLYKAIRRDYI
jgi:radical SAM superfamily enzyme YgiQ (UPF0313 family)